MPFTKIIIHAVWATKDRKPLLNKQKKDTLCHHLIEYAASKSIYVYAVNGYLNHIHCLFALAPEQNIATIMNLLKGESSHWANKNLLFSEKFGWQDEYFAVSVSKSHFEVVKNYIDCQEAHHRNKTFQEEYNEFIENYQFEE